MSKPTNMLIKQHVVKQLHAAHLTLQQCIDKTAELVALYKSHKLTLEQATRLRRLYDDTWKQDMNMADTQTVGFFPVKSFQTIQELTGGMTPSQAAMIGMLWIIGND